MQNFLNDVNFSIINTIIHDFIQIFSTFQIKKKYPNFLPCLSILFFQQTALLKI